MRNASIQSSQPSSPTQPGIAGSTLNTNMIAGHGILTAPLTTYQMQSTPIKLTNLPAELLALIMHTIDDSISVLMLSHTCTSFHSLYQAKAAYKAHERQSHIFMYNLTIPSLHEQFYTKLINQNFGKIYLPDPYTDEWRALRDQPIKVNLRGEARQIALAQKAYIIAWDLLLHPKTLANRMQASQLMRVLLDLLPHIEHAGNYVEKLFYYGLSWNIFQQLAHIHLDRCVQLVSHHFSMIADTPAYQFIIAQFPDQAKLPELIRQLKHGNNESVLIAAIKSFYIGDSVLEDQLLVELCQLLYERGGCDLEQQTTDKSRTALTCAILHGSAYHIHGTPSHSFPLLVNFLLEKGANCNARDKDGITPLMWACELGKAELVPLLLQRPQINVNVRNNQDQNALLLAIKSDNLSIITTLLQHPQLKADLKSIREAINQITHPHSNLTLLKNLFAYSTLHENVRLFIFYDTLIRGKSQVIDTLLNAINEQERKTLISTVLFLAKQRGDRAVERILRSEKYRQYTYSTLAPKAGQATREK